jgi:hypothetical protein
MRDHRGRVDAGVYVSGITISCGAKGVIGSCTGT